jgi:hypothetical protein
MVATRYPADLCVNVREQEARAEWRRLCFVLEGIQASHVIDKSPDKFTYARAYQAFQADELRVFATLAEAIAQGDFRFFIARGVSPSILTDSLARQLLRDWKSAIVSKQIRLAEAFEGRFGEDIDVFCLTQRNASSISSAKGDDNRNAVSLLDRWANAQPPIAC